MRPLRIGVDGRELLGEATGVGRYLAELLQRWTSRPDRARRRFVVYSPGALGVPLPADAAEIRIIGGASAPRGTWWEQTHLRHAIGRDSLDVFFAPAYTAPLGIRTPLVVTIHDISFIAHPEWFRTTERLRRRWLTRRAAARASVILTDSEFSRTELETRLRVPRSRIRVIPPGISIRTAPATAREPMVLFVGSLFNRRRVPDLIAAFARVVQAVPDSRLVIVGDNRTWPRQDLEAVPARHGVAARVVFRNYVSDEDLAGLYARARVFAFLSEYEGFGMTPLEALAAGVPPVVLDTPVAREVCQDAAVFVRRDDIGGAAEAIARLLTHPADAEPLLARGRELLKRYHWDAAAAGTLAAIEEAARR